MQNDNDPTSTQRSFGSPNQRTLPRPPDTARTHIQAIQSDRAARLTLGIVCLGVLVAQLDTSIVNLAVRPIGIGTAASTSELQWIVDSYNLVYACFLLTGGALGDLYGRKRLFVTGLCVFTLGSLACGLAPGVEALIAARALTGLGAALELPVSLAILAHSFPDPVKRARAIGIWASCNGLALAVGPTLGGLLVDTQGWRSIFLLVVPVCALAVAAALRFVSESSNREGRSLDLPGQALAACTIGALVFAVIEGPGYGWASWPTIFLLGGSLLSALAFLVVERRTGAAALVPLDIFRSKPFSASIAIAVLMTFGMYAMLFLAPIYLQGARGGTALEAGVELLPMSLTFFFVSQRAGSLAAGIGPRVVMTAGLVLMSGGLLALSFVAADTSIWLIGTAFLAIGAGLGLNGGPVMAVAIASVTPGRAGTASGVGNTARIMGATLGVAVLGAVFAAYAGARGVDGSAGTATLDGMLAGLRAAFRAGAAGEALGALIAFAFVRHDSLRPPDAVRV